MAEKIVKKDWVSNFSLIGRPKFNKFTYKIDEKAKESNWIYNSLNLGIDCGEKFGVVYAELMSGYSEDNENKIYAHGKNDDGSDNFDKRMVIDWDERNNADILENIGDLSFITIGLEKTNQNKTFYKKFLSAYDAIAYVKDHLTEDMVVNVRGNLKYSMYDGVVQVKKIINSIALSTISDPSDYRATFTQSVLIDKDSASLKDIDKDKSVMFVNATVLDYMKEIDGVEVKGQYPFKYQFEFKFDNLGDGNLCQAIYNKLFKVKKNVRQITFKGELIESGAAVATTFDDLNPGVKELVALGLYTEQEALASCATNKNREKRMVLRKPHIKNIDAGGDEKVSVIQVFDDRYTEEDLVLDCLNKPKTNHPVDEETPFDTDDDDNNLDWLSKL